MLLASLLDSLKWHDPFHIFFSILLLQAVLGFTACLFWSFLLNSNKTSLKVQWNNKPNKSNQIQSGKHSDFNGLNEYQAFYI